MTGSPPKARNARNDAQRWAAMMLAPSPTQPAPRPQYLCHSDGMPHNAETFDLDEWLAERVPKVEMLGVRECRIALTKYDPMLFAIMYFPHVLRKGMDAITFCDLH